MHRVCLALAMAVLASPALAHTGVGDAAGFAHGVVHPLGGADHVLAMVAVGLLAARLGGRALWLVPLSFLAMMAVGGALGAAGLSIPFVDIGIALSVLAFGAALALHLDIPLAAAMAFVGLFAVFHGHAHGSEMPSAASGVEYGLGFVLATGLLHFVGIGIGLVLDRLGERQARRVARIAGGAMAVAGAGLLAGAI